MLLHSIDDILGYTQPIIVLIAIVAFIMALVCRFSRTNSPDEKAKRSKFFAGAVIVFVSVLVFELLWESVVTSAALVEVNAFLRGKISSVKCNGKDLANPSAFLIELRGISRTLGHHSHPLQSFEVKLLGDDGEMTLIFARDSGNPNEYWVFYPAYNATTIADIGHVFSPELTSLRK